jgi:hypothetical protein
MISQKSVAILYGFGEGRWHGRKLRSALLAANFDVADSPHDADIIIAHSGGMYALPEVVSDKTVFLVGPSCGQPDKTWLQTQSKKVWLDMRSFIEERTHIAWLQKSYWNVLYLLQSIPRLPHLWRIHHQHQACLPIIAAKTLTVVVFKNDPWSGYLRVEERLRHSRYTFITVDASHDDIWLNPERYVELVRSCNSTGE